MDHFIPVMRYMRPGSKTAPKLRSVAPRVRTKFSNDGDTVRPSGGYIRMALQSQSLSDLKKLIVFGHQNDILRDPRPYEDIKHVKNNVADIDNRGIVLQILLGENEETLWKIYQLIGNLVSHKDPTMQRLGITNKFTSVTPSVTTRPDAKNSGSGASSKAQYASFGDNYLRANVGDPSDRRVYVDRPNRKWKGTVEHQADGGPQPLCGSITSAYLERTSKENTLMGADWQPMRREVGRAACDLCPVSERTAKWALARKRDARWYQSKVDEEKLRANLFKYYGEKDERSRDLRQRIDKRRRTRRNQSRV